MIRRLMPALIALALLIPAGAAEAATDSLWTPVNSGTTDTISAIVYQSPSRFWYATTNGHIEYFNGSAFVAGSGVTPGEDFTGLSFQPPSVAGNPGTAGLYGYAVTNNGHVWQTSNGGVSWTMLASPVTRSDCSATSTVTTVSELNAVAWGGSNAAYLLGNDSTLEKAANANTPVPTFTEINKVGTDTCAAQSDTSTRNLTDATFLPGNAADGLIVTQDFGSLYSTSNAWASGIKLSDGTVNNFQGSPHIAQAPGNPNQVWVVDHAPGGGGCGTLCLVVSTDGGTTSGPAKFPSDATPVVGLYGISSEGGTEVAAGTGGEIFNSVNGTDFFLNPAPGTLRTANWRAEGAYDAAHAAVGGEGGALAVSTEVNHTSPPKQPPSGTGAATTGADGAKLTFFRTVTVTGRNARYVPILVSATKPRRFVAQVLALKGKKALGTGRLTIRGKHGGHGTIQVKLGAKVKPGRYRVVVHETTLKGRKVGKPITFKFTLK
ncbi:MAG TPA: hypothetical protein VHW96_23810 [Solirubrobacteraceae bacterium]|jgi:hypothetical protein|nr:hypothetical protein [Solirubrobacteraceae bacterium]